MTLLVSSQLHKIDPRTANRFLASFGFKPPPNIKQDGDKLLILLGIGHDIDDPKVAQLMEWIEDHKDDFVCADHDEFYFEIKFKTRALAAIFKLTFL